MTRLVRFANNATSKLASNLSSVGLTMSVTPGDGAKFPALTAGQFFKATLIKNDGTKEVVKVTARTSDTMTIARANEAVGGVQTAYPFSAGDKVELRLTATALGDELDRLDAAAFLDVVGKSANYTIVEADVSKLIKTDTTAGNVTITLPQISTLTGSFEVQVSKNTGDTNTVSVVRSGTDTINGLNSYNLSAQYQCVWLVADLATGTWTAITSASASNRVTDIFTGSGAAGPFTLSGDPGSKNNTDVFVGGVYQQKSTYTLSGTQLTLGGNVGAGVSIEVNWSQPLAIGTPSDGTVTTAKLAAVIAPTVSSLNGGQLAGVRNKIINGAMAVVQRGNAALSNNSIVYGGPDRWMTGLFNFTTATGIVGQLVGQPVASSSTGFMHIISGLTTTGTGLVQVRQRIEAVNAFGLNGKTITVSGNVAQDTGSTQSLTVRLNKANSADSFGATTLIANAAATAVPSGAVTKFTATFNLAVTDASNGLELVLEYAGVGAFTAKNFYLSDVQLEIGSVATAFEQRPFGVEMTLCHRYYWRGGAAGNAGVAFMYAGSPATADSVGPYIPTPDMRATPTMAIVVNPVYNSCSTFDVAASQAGGAIHRLTPVANSAYRAYGGTYTASAEL